jgi:hypothetical protein
MNEKAGVIPNGHDVHTMFHENFSTAYRILKGSQTEGWTQRTV